MTIVWVMIIVVKWGGGTAVTQVEFATRDQCLRSLEYVATRPGTKTAYCIPADRR